MRKIFRVSGDDNYAFKRLLTKDPGENPSRLYLHTQLLSFQHATLNKLNNSVMKRGRCYDHNFLRFSTIFCEKMAFFSKNNVMIKFWNNLAVL
jgi:hypothetical protein